VDTSNMENKIWHETQVELNEKMLTLHEMVGLSCLTSKLKTFYNFFWIERDKTGTMIDETIVYNLMSPLILPIMFFMMQNVRAPLWNYLAKLWNSA
jgi:accessory gene regulator protein AgrB